MMNDPYLYGCLFALVFVSGVTYLSFSMFMEGARSVNDRFKAEEEKKRKTELEKLNRQKM